MLSQKYDHRHLEQTLLSREAWRPYPTWEAREAWNRLPASVRRAYLALGEEVAETPWPHVLATRYLDYSRDGNRSRHAEPYFARRSMLTSLTVAECIEGQGRFLDEIVNGIWLICEESSWCIPAHVRVQAAGVDLPDINEPIVDLFAAETGSTLAWVYYLLGDRLDTVSVLVRPRIRQEVEERILAPAWPAMTFHGWALPGSG